MQRHHPEAATGHPIETMVPFRFRRRSAKPARIEPDLPELSQPAPLPDVSQPLPLEDSAARDPVLGISVTELSELEARALCAREDIPVFWRRKRLGGEDAA